MVSPSPAPGPYRAWVIISTLLFSRDFPEDLGKSVWAYGALLSPTVLRESHEQEKEALTLAFQEAKAALQVR